MFTVAIYNLTFDFFKIVINVAIHWKSENKFENCRVVNGKCYIMQSHVVYPISLHDGLFISRSTSFNCCVQFWRTTIRNVTENETKIQLIIDKLIKMMIPAFLTSSWTTPEHFLERPCVQWETRNGEVADTQMALIHLKILRHGEEKWAAPRENVSSGVSDQARHKPACAATEAS